MYPELKTRLMNSLKAELDYVAKFEKDKMKKFEKMLQIKNMISLIEQYEDIEPKIAEIVNENARKKKWEREDR